MIPLMRPIFPEWEAVQKHFKKSMMKGALSNFGPCFFEVVDRLSVMTDLHSLPVANGTIAIQVALQMTVKRGARVLVPDYTHIGTLQAVTAAGMEPVIVSSSKTSWTLSIEEMAKIPTDYYDAFIVVSPFGYRVDFGAYEDFANMTRKKIVYDLAGAWGMVPKTDSPVCYSLHATKNFSCGEGGVVAFRSRQRMLEARRLINFDTLEDRTVASPFGGNWKLDELKCAVILAHLDNFSVIEKRAKERSRTIDQYQRALKGLCIPSKLHEQAQPSLCVLSGLPAAKLEALAPAEGITIKRYYIPLSSMPGLSSVKKFSTCSQFFQTCAALPADVTDEEFDKVIRFVRAQTKVGARASHR